MTAYSRALRRCLAGLLATVPLVCVAPASADESAGHWSWPLTPDPAVAREFEPPASEYGAGHRGADLVGRPGDWVRSVADGVVSFAGEVAGVGVLSVDHGGETSTYQPVATDLHAGDHVRAGEPVGHLLSEGSHCVPRACLHLGRKIGNRYADPLALLGTAAARIRLMTPYGRPPVPPAPVMNVAVSGSGALLRPVDGPVTSPFGMRTHPLTGVHKLHDGTDLGVPCGTPVRAAADGVVTGQYFNEGYGNRVLLEHGTIAGQDLATTYNHLDHAAVHDGQRVRRGQVVGYVGQTGYATGCHLHFMVLANGGPIDPMTWL